MKIRRSAALRTCRAPLAQPVTTEGIIMKQRSLILAAVAAIATIAAAAAYAYPAMYCQFDNLPLSPTGASKQANGQTFDEFSCPNGHYFWVQR